MTTPISTFQDILDAMERNPHLREEMRRHVLGEELLRLPAVVAELSQMVRTLADTVDRYISATNERLARLEAGQEELRAGLTRLEAGHAKLEAGHAKLEAGQEELRAGLTRLEARQDSMDGKLNNLIGNDYERRAARNASRYLSRYANIRNARLLQAVTLPDHNHVPDLLTRALESGAITHPQADELDRSDLILLGDTADDSEPTYAVVEVPVTIDDHDVDRAKERADIMRAASGISSSAIVIGVGISEANRERAGYSGVTVIIMSE